MKYRIFKYGDDHHKVKPIYELDSPTEIRVGDTIGAGTLKFSIDAKEVDPEDKRTTCGRYKVVHREIMWKDKVTDELCYDLYIDLDPREKLAFSYAESEGEVKSTKMFKVGKLFVQTFCLVLIFCTGMMVEQCKQEHAPKEQQPLLNVYTFEVPSKDTSEAPSYYQLYSRFYGLDDSTTQTLMLQEFLEIKYTLVKDPAYLLNVEPVGR